MSEKDTGGPAFPFPTSLYPDGSTNEPGHISMTLRDYFAAKAMQAHIAALSSAVIPDWHAQVAELSYLTADAMLEARK